MAGFRHRRRASGAAADGDGRDPTGVAPARRGRFGSGPNRRADGGDSDAAAGQGAAEAYGARAGGREAGGLSDQQIAASRPRATAVEYGISMLAARSWPEKKLREKIRTRYSEEETDAAIVRLHELRLVDDDSWAERYARDRFERLGKGRMRIRMELMGKGIAAATADAALERVVGGDDERAKAAAMLEVMRGRLARGPGASRSATVAGTRDASGPGSATQGDPGLDGADQARRFGPRIGPAGDPEHGAEHDSEAGPALDPRERRAQAERLKNRLFRRMLARGFPASVVRDLLEIS